jgi:type I restriction enzyme S subunit
VNSDLEDHVVSTKFMVIKSNGLLHPRLVYINLKQEETILKFNVMAESRSGTFPQITFESIKSISLVVPEKLIQVAYISRISSFIQKQILIEKENKKLSIIRDTLLPKLLSGEVAIN